MGSLLHCKLGLLSLLFPSLLFIAAVSTTFEVGGEKGWVLRSSSHDADFYNHWASENRFKVNDIVHFKYEKDSVLVVTEEEYDKCRSARPLFFANNGDTAYTLDRPGLFYFISGVAGHCQRGEKMIIKVLEPKSSPPPAESPANQTASHLANSAYKIGRPASATFISILLISICMAVVVVV